ncbi:TAP-like protein-domain-containing protein [Mycena galopus ATCC 62051]|nr:TAP-like protein-domain-containing protein [Mycena galopus ATCC 62051]
MAVTVMRLFAYSFPFLAIWFFLAEKSSYTKHQLHGETQQSENLTPHALAEDEFSWESITPTEELIWTDCYSNNQCARLKVPLDYAHPEGRSAAIAMIRVHSGVPHDSPRYRGPVLINPGGPGGSGVDTVARRGELFSTIIGPEFDIIGFDPRGIARSTPRASFFASRAEREIWSVPDAQYASMNASTDALSRAWARGMVIGQLAGERDDGSLQFITTDHTARDMLKIVEAHGQDKLQYWGFSYGSVLGAAFASMFPQNVGRLVIDGVEDSENYFATLWDNNLLDTEKVWMAFVDGCVAAGPNGCAFFAPTAAEILDNVEKISESLRARPIPVRTSTSFGVVDYSMLRRTIFQALYSPYALFPTLAQALADVSQGNGTALFKISEIPAFECACGAAQYRFESVREGLAAVLCNDGKRISSEYDKILANYRSLSKASNWADVWASVPLQCLAWPDFPKNHFQGPFVANTSFPLLLIGNTADPVTPLWAAKKMSQGFTGSVVLTQDSAGHCSISGVSLCTHKYIRQYFFDGTLPSPGTICPVDALPFPLSDFAVDGDKAQASLSISAADLNVLEAVQKLATTFDFRFPIGI